MNAKGPIVGVTYRWTSAAWGNLPPFAVTSISYVAGEISYVYADGESAGMPLAWWGDDDHTVEEVSAPTTGIAAESQVAGGELPLRAPPVTGDIVEVLGVGMGFEDKWFRASVGYVGPGAAGDVLQVVLEDDANQAEPRVWPFSLRGDSWRWPLEAQFEIKHMRSPALVRRIVVAKRSEDWHACLEGRPAVWGCGRNIYEAIGNLVNAHVDEFGIDVVSGNVFGVATGGKS